VFASAWEPQAVFALPSVLEVSALVPTAVLSLPTVSANSAPHPKALSLDPLVLFESASCPSLVLKEPPPQLGVVTSRNANAVIITNLKDRFTKIPSLASSNFCEGLRSAHQLRTLNLRAK
jgi:hypothetical protein